MEKPLQNSSKEKKSIILSLRYKGSLFTKDSINFFQEKFKDLGISFDDLNYSVLDKTTSNWKQLSKSYKLTTENINKFNEAISKLGASAEVGFELLKMEKDGEYKSRDISCVISCNSNSEISSLNFIMETEKFKKKINNNFEALVKLLIEHLKSNKCEVVYGFIYQLENFKFPSLYTEGIGSEGINDLERKDLDIWLRKMNKCDHQVWKIFWGNMINPKYPKYNLILEEIKKIVSDKNYAFIEEDLLFFNLPEPINEFDLDQYSKSREKLIELFRNHNLIME